MSGYIGAQLWRASTSLNCTHKYIFLGTAFPPPACSTQFTSTPRKYNTPVRVIIDRLSKRRSFGGYCNSLITYPPSVVELRQEDLPLHAKPIYLKRIKSINQPTHLKNALATCLIHPRGNEFLNFTLLIPQTHDPTYARHPPEAQTHTPAVQGLIHCIHLF
jgi:hypothetical protein